MSVSESEANPHVRATPRPRPPERTLVRPYELVRLHNSDNVGEFCSTYDQEECSTGTGILDPVSFECVSSLGRVVREPLPDTRIERFRDAHGNLVQRERTQPAPCYDANTLRTVIRTSSREPRFPISRAPISPSAVDDIQANFESDADERQDTAPGVPRVEPPPWRSRGIVLAALSPDSSSAVTFYWDATLERWVMRMNDMNSPGYEEAEIPMDKPVSACFSPNMTDLLVLDRTGVAVLYPLRGVGAFGSGARRVGSDAMVSASFRYDGSNDIITVSREGFVENWNASTGDSRVLTRILEGPGNILSATVNGDATRVLYTTRVSEDHVMACVHNVRTAVDIRLPVSDVQSASFSPDGNLCALTGFSMREHRFSRHPMDWMLGDWNAYVFNAASGEELMQLGSEGAACFAEFSPDGSIVVAMTNGTIQTFTRNGGVISRVWIGGGLRPSSSPSFNRDEQGGFLMALSDIDPFEQTVESQVRFFNTTRLGNNTTIHSLAV